jgi:hypothetical protein
LSGGFPGCRRDALSAQKHPAEPFFHANAPADGAIRAADGVNGAADGAIRVADGASGTPDGAIGSANGAIGVANGVIGVADGAVFSIGKTNFERGGTIRPLVYPAFALKNPVLPPIRPLPLFLLVNLNKITNE